MIYGFIQIQNYCYHHISNSTQHKSIFSKKKKQQQQQQHKTFIMRLGASFVVGI